MKKISTQIGFYCLMLIVTLFIGNFSVSAQTNNSAATVTTDKPDYAPRSNAIFTGSGFQPGETVALKVKNLFRACNTVTADSSYLPWTATADATGRFVTNWTVCDCVGDSLRLRAVGQSSHDTAYAYFSDGQPQITSVSEAIISPQNLDLVKDKSTITILNNGPSAVNPLTIVIRKKAVSGAINSGATIRSYNLGNTASNKSATQDWNGKDATDANFVTDGIYSIFASNGTTETIDPLFVKEITVDNTKPTVTINQASGQADPTTNSTINFTVVFSEPVTGFASNDVVLGGTATGSTATVTAIGTAGTDFSVTVSGMTINGTVTASIGANAATDAAGNGNTASTFNDNTVTYNGICTPPSITTQPSSNIATFTYGSNTSFGVVAGGTLPAGAPDYTYQWEVSTNSGSTWTSVANGGVYSGATTSTLTLTLPPVAMNGYRYRAVVTGACTPTATSDGTAALTVKLKGLTVTTANASKIYGQTFDESTFTGSITGVQGTDGIVVSGRTSAGSAASANVTTYPITASLSDPNNKLGNYTVTNTPGTLTVTQATPTVTLTVANNLVYNSTPQGASAATIKGVNNEELGTVLYTGKTGTTYSSATAPTAAGDYNVAVSFAGNTNYVAAGTNKDFSIAKKGLTVTTANASKIYGQTFDESTFTGSITGVQGTDGIVVSGRTSAGSAASANVTTYPITASLSDPNNKLGNYTVTNTPGTLTVTQATPTVTLTVANNLVYNSTPQGASAATIKGVNNEELGTVLYTGKTGTTYSSATAPTAAGDYNVAVSFAGNTNYVAAGTNKDFSIAKKGLTVTTANASKIYGQTFDESTFTGSITGVQGTDGIVVSGRTSAGSAASANVTTYPITASLSDPNNKLGNYTVTNTPGTLTVTQATPTVTLTVANNLVYNSTPQGASAATIKGVNNEELGTVLYTGKTGTTYSSATAPTAAGDYNVAVSFAGNTNYVAAGTNKDFSIAKKDLTVTTANASKIYGQTFDESTFTGSITGVQGTDGIVVSGRTSAGSAASANVTTYPITASLSDPNNKLGNYTVTNTPGTLTVTQATPTVTLTVANNLVYNSTPQGASAATIKGVNNEELGTVLYTGKTGTTYSSATAPTAAGDYNVAVSFAGNTNYVAAGTNKDFSIAKKGLTVTTANASKIYGQTFDESTFTGSITGVQGTDGIVVSGRTSAGSAASANVTTYPITASLSDPNNKLGNYTVTNTPGTLTVTQATPTVTLTVANNLVYNSTPQGASAATIKGVNNEELGTVLYTGKTGTTYSSATAPTAAGDYNVAVSFAGNTNYVAAGTNKDFSIAKKGLTVTTGNASKIYGQTFDESTFTGSITGVQGTDGIVVSGRTSAGSAASANVTTYPITASLSDPNNKLGNYTVTNTPGTLTVTQATPTVTLTVANNLVYNSTPQGASAATIKGVNNEELGTVLYTGKTGTTYSSATAPTAAGDYNVAVSFAGNTNYVAAGTNKDFSIAKKDLTVTTANASKIYGQTFDESTFTGSITGVQGTDGIVVSGRTSAGSAASANVTTYPITASLSDPNNKLGNYTVTNTPGTLTVTQATPTVTLTVANNLVYNSTPQGASAATIKGVNNEELGTVLYTGKTGTTYSSATAPTAAGDYNVAVSFAGNTNYVAAGTNKDFSIAKKDLTVTTANASKIYGQTFDESTFTGSITGVQGTDGIVVSGRTSAGSAASANVTTYPITASLSDPNNKLGNYTVTNTPGTLTVTQATPTVTLTVANNLVYNSTPQGASAATIKGVNNEELGTVLYTGKTGTTYSSATAPTAAGDYNVAVSFAGNTNYVAAGTNKDFSIAKKDLTVTTANASKIYGQTFDESTFTGSITGVQGTDGIVVSGRTSAGSAASANVTTYPITASLSDPNNKLGNYTVTNTPGTLTVTQATPTVTLTVANNLVYNSTPQGASAATIKGVNNEELGTVLYTGKTGTTYSSATAPTAAGDYNVAVSFAGNTNYVAAGTNKDFSIAKKGLTVTTANASKIYGQTFDESTFTGSITGVQGTDGIVVSGRTSAGSAASANVTTYPITASLSDPNNKLGNYTVTNTPGTLTVTQATPTVTLTVANNLVYNSTPQGASAATIKGVNNEELGTVLYTGKTGTTYSSATAPTAAGDYNVAVSFAGNTNYVAAGTNKDFSIAKKDLTVTTANASKIYGQTFDESTFTGSITGVQGTDGIVVSGRTSAGSAASANVTTYPITASLSDPNNKLGNYTVTNTPGTLTVTQATPTVTLTVANNLVYNSTPQGASAATIKGVNNEELGTVLYTGKTGTTYSSATAPTAAGDYNVAVSFAGNTNYVAAGTNKDFSIAKKGLTVTTANASKIYGQTFDESTFTGSITGVQGTDGIVVSGRTSAGSAASANVTTYPITASLSDPNNKLGNYTVTNTPGTLTVTQATPTVTLTVANNLVYNSTPQGASAATIKGVNNEELGTVLYTGKTGTTYSSATAPTAAGDYNVAVSFAGNTNYVAAGTNKDFSIAKKGLTVTTANASKIYGQTFDESTFTGSITGVQGTDGIVVSGRTSAGSAASANVTTYPITASLSDPNNKLGNYTVTNTPGTLTVTQATLIVTTNPSTKVYGTANPTFSVSYDAFVNGDNASKLGGTLAFATSATAGSGVGSYDVTPGGLTSNNYSITFKKGTLTVTPAALTVKANSYTILCGQALPVYTGVITGILNNDQISATYALTTPANGVGNYDIMPTLSGAALVNYTVAPPTKGMLTINGVNIDGSANVNPQPIKTGATSVTIKVTTTTGANAPNVSVSLYVDDNPTPKKATTDPTTGIATFDLGVLAADVYRLRAVAGEGCTETTVYLPIYDASGGFVTGGGWINSPVYDLLPYMKVPGKANFGFVSKYEPGKQVPTGNTEFQFKEGDLNFSSTSYDWLVVSGKKAQYKGTGTIKGTTGTYGFILTAWDGDLSNPTGPDMFRIKIYDKASNKTVYDNQYGNGTTADDADPTTVLGGGSIVIHTKTNGSNATSTPSIVTASAVAPTQQLFTERFSATAYPNPTVSYFTIKLSSGNTKDAIAIRVIDEMGRLVEMKNNLAEGQTIQIGQAYRSGIYFVEVMQGNTRRQLKLIKNK